MKTSNILELDNLLMKFADSAIQHWYKKTTGSIYDFDCARQNILDWATSLEGHAYDNGYLNRPENCSDDFPDDYEVN